MVSNSHETIPFDGSSKPKLRGLTQCAGGSACISGFASCQMGSALASLRNQLWRSSETQERRAIGESEPEISIYLKSKVMSMYQKFRERKRHLTLNEPDLAMPGGNTAIFAKFGYNSSSFRSKNARLVITSLAGLKNLGVG